jgi:Domain of unknown function (DUF4839)/PASTA domain
MRAVRLVVLVVAVVAIAALAGCGGDKASTTMPDVTGKKLDDAKSAIKDAGYGDEVKVDGGGLFGVVVESNWEVCEQNPAAGTTVAGKPTLTVARSCVDDKSSEEPEATPSETTPEETAPAKPQAAATLTPRNNKDLAALLVGSDCDEKVAAFAKKYAGQTIAFNGSILDIAPHGSYKTRYDILIGGPGNGPNTAKGPNFQLRDVGRYELHLPDSVEGVNVGDKFRFIAEVGEFNPVQCLFVLEPVKTIPR